MRNLPAPLLALFGLFSGCTSHPSVPAVGGGSPPTADIGAWGFDLQGQDTSVAAGDDFDSFANGSWKSKFSIPADLASYGVFIQLRLDAETDVRSIVEELSSADSPQDSLEAKVGMAYGAWMDEAAIEKRGTAPLLPVLAEIAKIRDFDGVADAFASVHQPAPYSVGVIPDPADTTRYIAFAAQSGLGMPNRDYYLNEGEQFEHYRNAYTAFIAKLFELAGVADAKKKAGAVVALETEIAAVHWTPADSRDIRKIYNPMTLEQFAALAPSLNLRQGMSKLGLADVPTFIVAQPSAIQAASEIISAAELETVKDYLAFHAIRTGANQLPRAFDTAHFEFYGKTLNGTTEQRARWKRGVSFINGSLGEAVGKIYVKRHFPAAAKVQMDALVANLVDALRARINSNLWMDQPTKAQALAKLATFEPRIGFPSKWTDYTPLIITENAFENARSVAEFQWREQTKRLAGKVDREVWDYPPQTVNASYNPLLNQITFPAGILQPPFFDPSADPAVNYGAIGAVIGHEIGHGFDDQGRRFDENGVIRDWWTKEADAAYTKLTDALGMQYAAYEVLPGLNVNPQLTMGENIGDLGGLQMAYEAYRRSLNGEDAPVLDGLTGDQRFFLGWAQVWRAMSRDDAMRQRILTDPHSLPRFRVNGIVRNMDAWYAAFEVTEEHALFLPKDKRVVIW